MNQFSGNMHSSTFENAMSKRFNLQNKRSSVKFRKFMYDMIDNYNKNKFITNKHFNLIDLELNKFIHSQDKYEKKDKTDYIKALLEIKFEQLDA